MNRSEKRDAKDQILTILQGNSHSIAQKCGETWAEQRVLQPILIKSDRLLDSSASGENPAPPYAIIHKPYAPVPSSITHGVCSLPLSIAPNTASAIKADGISATAC